MSGGGLMAALWILFAVNPCLFPSLPSSCRARAASGGTEAQADVGCEYLCAQLCLSMVFCPLLF